jgi:hypothetical protein
LDGGLGTPICRPDRDAGFDHEEDRLRPQVEHSSSRFFTDKESSLPHGMKQGDRAVAGFVDPRKELVGSKAKLKLS